MSQSRTSRPVLPHLTPLLLALATTARQHRTRERLLTLCLGYIQTLGRHTITGVLRSLGRADHDWSAAYRLFARARFDLDAGRRVLLATVLDTLGPDAPLVVVLDGTQLARTSPRLPGVDGRAPVAARTAGGPGAVPTARAGGRGWQLPRGATAACPSDRREPAGAHHPHPRAVRPTGGAGIRPAGTTPSRWRAGTDPGADPARPQRLAADPDVGARPLAAAAGAHEWALAGQARPGPASVPAGGAGDWSRAPGTAWAAGTGLPARLRRAGPGWDVESPSLRRRVGGLGVAALGSRSHAPGTQTWLRAGTAADLEPHRRLRGHPLGGLALRHPDAGGVSGLGLRAGVPAGDVAATATLDGTGCGDGGPAGAVADQRDGVSPGLGSDPGGSPRTTPHHLADGATRHGKQPALRPLSSLDPPLWPLRLSHRSNRSRRAVPK